MSDESGPLTPLNSRRLGDPIISIGPMVSAENPGVTDPFREAQERRAARDHYYAGQAIAQGMDPEEAMRRIQASGLPEEIERLALTNTLVASLRQVYMQGGCSREQCLVAMIEALAEQNRVLIEAQVKIMQAMPPGVQP